MPYSGVYIEFPYEEASELSYGQLSVALKGLPRSSEDQYREIDWYYSLAGKKDWKKKGTSSLAAGAASKSYTYTGLKEGTLYNVGAVLKNIQGPTSTYSLEWISDDVYCAATECYDVKATLNSAKTKVTIEWGCDCDESTLLEYGYSYYDSSGRSSSGIISASSSSYSFSVTRGRTYTFEIWPVVDVDGTAVDNIPDEVTFSVPAADEVTVQAINNTTTVIASVSPADSTAVTKGSTVTFTATLKDDDTGMFSGWRTGPNSTDTLKSMHNPYQVAVSSNTTLYANADRVLLSAKEIGANYITVQLSSLYKYMDSNDYVINVYNKDDGILNNYNQKQISYADLKDGYQVTGLRSDTEYSINIGYIAGPSAAIRWIYVSGTAPTFTTTAVSIKATNGNTSGITSVSPSSETKCDYGEAVSLKAELKDEYLFTGWEVTDSNYNSYANPYNINVYGTWIAKATAKACNIIFPKTTATSINIKTDIEMPNYYVYDIYVWDVTDNKEKGLYPAYTDSSFNAESGVTIGGLTTDHTYRFNIFYYEKGKASAGHWLISGGKNAGRTAICKATAVISVSSTYNSITLTATTGTMKSYKAYQGYTLLGEASLNDQTKATFSNLFPGSTYYFEITFTDGQILQVYGTTQTPILTAEVNENTVVLTITGGTAYTETSWSAYRASDNAQFTGDLFGGYTQATFINLEYTTEYIFYCSYRVADGSGSKISDVAISVKATTGAYKPRTYTLTIVHHQQKLDLNTYTEKNTTTHDFEEGTLVTAKDYAKTYNGFTYNRAEYNGVEKTTIAISGNMTVSYYYNRNSYTITVTGNNVQYFKAGDDETEYANNSKLKFLYEQSVKIQVVGNGRYAWKSWSASNGVTAPTSNPTSFSMPYKDFTLTANLEEGAPPVNPWEWNDIERKAFTKVEGDFTKLTADRWKEFCERFNAVVTEKKYADTYKITVPTIQKGSVLTADSFNHITSQIAWLGYTKFNQPTYYNKRPQVNSGDIVYGQYFIDLETALNELINAL